MFVSVFLSRILTIIQPKCSLTYVFVSLSYDSDFDSDDVDDDDYYYYYYYHDHTMIYNIQYTGKSSVHYLQPVAENLSSSGTWAKMECENVVKKKKTCRGNMIHLDSQHFNNSCDGLLFLTYFFSFYGSCCSNSVSDNKEVTMLTLWE